MKADFDQLSPRLLPKKANLKVECIFISSVLNKLMLSYYLNDAIVYQKYILKELQMISSNKLSL